VPASWALLSVLHQLTDCAPLGEVMGTRRRQFTRRSKAQPASAAPEEGRRPGALYSRLLQWSGKRVSALVAVVVVAVVTATVGLMVTRAGERTKASTEAAKPAVIIRADYNWDSADGVQWALPKAPTAEDARMITTPLKFDDPRTIERLEDYLGSRKGVKFATLRTRGQQLARVKLSIQSTREHTVAVSDLRMHTLMCGPPLRGGLVFGPPEGAYDIPSLAFDLDTAETSAQSMGEDGRFKGSYFSRKFVTVGRDEPMVLLVHAFTAKRYCQWELVLTATVDGVETQYRVRRPNGAPFETTALTRSYDQAFEIDFFKGVFKKAPPGRLPTGLEEDLGKGGR
jgi:hypothetical protein